MIDVPDGGLAGIFAGLMGLRRSVDAALCLLAQGFAGIVARLLRGLFLRGADVDAIGITADPGEAGSQCAGERELGRRASGPAPSPSAAVIASAWVAISSARSVPLMILRAFTNWAWVPVPVMQSARASPVKAPCSMPLTRMATARTRRW
jgi:hypothetical protein